MALTRCVAFCIDECLGVKIAPALRDLRAPSAPRIHSVQELGLSGTTDELLFKTLREKDFAAMVTKDSAILGASIRREAWEASRLSLFVMHGNCGNLSLFEQARRLVWWWPEIVRQTIDDQAPAAWKIRKDMNGLLERY